MTYQFGRIWQVLGNQNKEIRLNLHKQGEKRNKTNLILKRLEESYFNPYRIKKAFKIRISLKVTRKKSYLTLLGQEKALK